MAEFSRKILALKLKQSLLLIVLMAFLTSYFLAVYLMSQTSFSEIGESLTLMTYAYKRTYAVVNILYSVQEQYFYNQTLMIDHGREEMFNYYIKEGMEIEQGF